MQVIHDEDSSEAHVKVYGTPDGRRKAHEDIFSQVREAAKKDFAEKNVTIRTLKQTNFKKEECLNFLLACKYNNFKLNSNVLPLILMYEMNTSRFYSFHN